MIEARTLHSIVNYLELTIASGLESIVTLINERKLGFLYRHLAYLNELCGVFHSEATYEIELLKSKLIQK